MESVPRYFEHIPSAHRAAILIVGILIFWVIENHNPLFVFKYNKWKHAGINIFFTATTIIINFTLAFALLWASDWTNENNFGIVIWLKAISFQYSWIVGLLLLDLIGAWWAHWVQHKSHLLWKFHVIHHSDQEVDTTTANRHHPGESIIRFVFTFIAIFLTGAPLWLVFLYQSLSVVLSQFNHANIVLPKWLDKAVSWIIVTPNMHHIHHHYMQPYSDSNYGNIFSFWDKLFGTFKSMNPKHLTYGIDTDPNPTKNNHVTSLLTRPFKPDHP